MFNAMVAPDPENVSGNEDDIVEWKMRKRTKGKAIRILRPREEMEETQEEQNPCYPWTKGKAIRILGPIAKKEEIREEQIDELESEGTSTMPNSPVTGAVWDEIDQKDRLKKKANL